MKTEILKTRNYQQFNYLTGNREINQENVKKIVSSMKEQFLMRPIDVNENMEIIDGQHRFQACRILNFPIYYIVNKGWGLAEAQRLNANQKNWTTEQYLQGYCDMGNSDYALFKRLKSQYQDITFSVLLSVANLKESNIDGGYISEFKAGNFKFKNFNKTIEMLENIKSVKSYYKNYNNSRFCFALIKALKNPDFKMDIFLNKLSYQSSKLVDCSNKNLYLGLIEEIYNFRNRGEYIRLK